MSTLVKPTHASCPSDGSALVRHTHGKLTVDACPTCRGLWFTSDVIDQLRGQRYILDLEKGIRRAEGSRRTGDRMCPACPRESMSIVRVRGVEVDRCNRCGGVWFDEGELEHVRQRSMPTSTSGRPSHGRRVSESLVDGVVTGVLDIDVLGDVVELIGKAGMAAAEVGVGVAKGLLEVVLSAADGI